MRWILAIGLLVSCKLNPQALTEQGEVKNFTSSQDEHGTRLQVTLHDSTKLSECFDGDRSYNSLILRKEGSVFSNDLTKCKITATRITKDGDRYTEHMGMDIIEKGVRYFCDGAELCSAARDAIGNFLEILFLTSERQMNHAKKKTVLERYKVPLLNSGDHKLIEEYPPLPDDGGVPMRAYLVRIYAYINAYLQWAVENPKLKLRYRCDGCWKNVTFTGNNASHLNQTIKPLAACVRFNKFNNTVEPVLARKALDSPLRILKDTGVISPKIDMELSLFCPSDSIPHIFLTCKASSGSRIYYKCEDPLTGAIGTMPITRDHYGKTICAKLPLSYNLNMFNPNKVRKFSREKAKNGDYSFDDEIVTFRVTDSTCDQHTELSIDINKSS